MLAYSDIAADHWFIRRLPTQIQPYARLMRLDRPIGTWLLLLPCWWGLALAPLQWVSLWYALLFAVGAVVMRGAGCVVNDLLDRDLDRQIERTRARPLASGEIQIWQAVLLLAGMLLLGLLVLWQFNSFSFWLGAASLVLVFTYPLAKRITYWPQFVLGLTFNWGALLGWAAVQGSLGWPTIWLYLAGICWTLGYDTIYAHQDKRDDAIIGVKSLALKLGAQSREWIGGFYLATILLLTAAAYAADLKIGFYVLLPLMAMHGCWQLIGWQPDNPVNCLQRFKSNRDFGLIVLVALLLGHL
jgi:4-hydroxybenzoate polyprenyltransferase